MGYVVAHARKIKTLVGLANVAGHNSRIKVYGDNGAYLGDKPDWVVHPELAHLNKGDTHDPALLLHRWRERVASADLKRKPQKNASVAIEIVISATPGYLKTERDWHRYFDDSKEYLRKRFGADNMIQFVEHWDETTPHAHAIFVPIMYDHKNERLKFSSAEFLGGRGGLTDFQDTLASSVGQKYGLVRGSDQSKARHTNHKTYPSQARKILKEIEEKKAEVKQEIDHLVQVRSKELEFVASHKDGVLYRELASRLYELTSSETKQCWDAMKQKADEIRASRFKGKGQTPERERSRGR